MKNFTITLILISIAISQDLNAQWQTFVNPSDKALHSVYFLNTLTGYTCGDTGTVLKTTTGGTMWSNSNSGIPNNINMSDIQFLDENTGYCTGGVGSISGKVYKSTNGGTSWTQVFDTTGTGFRALFFANSNTGWVAGANGVVKYTSNGGTSWQSRNVNISSLTDVFAFSEDVVIITGFGSAGSIVRSTNGGQSWIFTSVPSDFADVRFVAFTNVTTGYMGGLKFGGNGVMGKTTNGGLNWFVLPGFEGPTPIEGAAVSGNTALIVRTDDTLSYTIDGGGTWGKQYVQTGGFDKSISIKMGLGCIVGRNSIAVNTGVSVNQISSEIPSKFELAQNYPNPFNPTTSIKFALPKSGFVSLKVYDIAGKEVATLVNEQLTAGTYEHNFNASALSSGVYFYRIDAGNFTEIKKMILVK
jgi:photosystem II stability/assembly factor-like uncharacterized protein